MLKLLLFESRFLSIKSINKEGKNSRTLRKKQAFLFQIPNLRRLESVHLNRRVAPVTYHFEFYDVPVKKEILLLHV